MTTKLSLARCQSRLYHGAEILLWQLYPSGDYDYYYRKLAVVLRETVTVTWTMKTVLFMLVTL